MPFHELPKHLHPDFRDANIIPAGPVEVDWNHKSTEALGRLYIFTQHPTKDWVGKRNQPTWSGPPIEVQNGRKAGIFDGTIQGTTPSGGQVEFAAPYSFTFLAQYYIGSISNQWQLMSHRGNGTTTCTFKAQWTADGDGNGHVAIGINSTSTLSVATPNQSSGEGVWHTVAASVTSGAAGADAAVIGACDGLEITNDGDSLGIGGSQNQVHICGQSFGVMWAGGVSIMGLWGRAMELPELIELTKNPNQLLKPATPLYFMSAAAAPPGVTAIPLPLHKLDYQFATIMAHRLNGVIQ